MTRKRPHRNQQPQGDSGPINPYKVVDDEDALAEEFKNIDYEPPTFRIPELDRILGNTEREVAQLVAIYKL